MKSNTIRRNAIIVLACLIGIACLNGDALGGAPKAPSNYDDLVKAKEVQQCVAAGRSFKTCVAHVAPVCGPEQPGSGGATSGTDKQKQLQACVAGGKAMADCVKSQGLQNSTGA